MNTLLIEYLLQININENENENKGLIKNMKDSSRKSIYFI